MDQGIQLTMTIAALVTTVTTIAYTVGTFLLWKTTQRSVKLATAQIELADRTAKGAILDEVFRSHREIFLRLIPNEFPLTALWESRIQLRTSDETTDIATQRVAEEVFASILINHVARLFHHYRQGLIGDAFWTGAREDMEDLFRNHVVRIRWMAVRNFHPTDFRDLIDGFLTPKA